MVKQIPRVNNMFLIGAGFTKAVFPDAPLNEDLLTVLCQGASCNTLKRYFKEHKTKDIEILLTRLDLDILHTKATRQTALQEVRKAIEEQIAVYFENFRFKEEQLKKSKWLETLATKLFKSNDAIITTNYDCFLEGLLDHFKVWSPNGGYIQIRNFSQEDIPENPKNIRIAKIHGSENFRLCPIFQDGDRRYVSFEINGALYPCSGKNRSLTEGGIDPEAYIIAPSFVKIPHGDIERMMIQVLDIADKAKNFIIIGCGMRPEDTFLWLLVTNFLYQKKADRRLIIVDSKADEIRAKIDSHYSRGIEGFCTKPILFSKDLESDCNRLIKCLYNLRKCEVN